MEKGGATRRKFLEDFVTHVICGKDFDETQIAEAQDLYDLPAIDERWVLASTKLGRLASTKPYDPLPNKLFSGLVFALTGGLSANDNKTLYAMIRFHGGVIDRNYTERTSFLICPSATGAAYAKAVAVGSERTKVVTPDWVLDCIQESRIVDAQNYHPALLIVSSMVIERKIIQVGLVSGNNDPETPNKSQGTTSDSEKKPQLPSKASNIPAQSSGIGAMIRPIKLTQSSAGTSIAVTTGQAKNIVIQQQVAPTGQINLRPVVVSQVITTPNNTNAPTTATITRKIDACSVKPEIDLKEQPQMVVQQIVASSIATAAHTPTTTLVNVQSQQPSQQGQIKITQQMVMSDQSKPTASGGPQSTTLTTIPKPQIVNTKQIQFIQNTNNPQGPKQTMIMQANAATGQIISQQPVSQVATGTAGGKALQQPGQQFQKHIILSHQELAQLQQQPGAFQGQQGANPPPGQNILIIQQQPGQPGQEVKLQQQSPQQSQSVPQSPVQTPQFSNVQFIRSNSQPVGSGTTTLMTSGGAMVTQQQVPQQPQATQMIQLQQQVVSGGALNQVQSQPQPGQQQQQQFIRAVGGGIVRGPGPQQQWTTGPQLPQQGIPQRHLIQLDPQTQAQWAMMDPAKKAEYIAKSRRNIMLQRQPVQFQGRPGTPQGPTGVVTTTRMGANGQQNIMFRGQWVQQQQQQQQQRQILVRSNAPSLSPIQQMVPGGVGPSGGMIGQQQQLVQQGVPQVMGQVPVVGQPGTVQVQMEGQPRPQFQRMTSLPGQKIIQQQTQQQIGGQTIQTTRYVTIDGSPLNPEQVQQMVQAGAAIDGSNQQQIISKTKTALANMLNSRMTGNNGVPGQPMPGDVVEPSAAGTLRLMTAHHNATLNQSMTGPRTQELLALQQQQQQQQRRTLGNITNAAGTGGGGGGVVVGGPGVGPTGPTMVPGVAVPSAVGHMHMSMVQQGPGGVMKSAAYSPGRAPQPRPQFYGHNPNLPKLPPELFLLGCNFFIVEYDETHAEDLFVWKELIRKHGGEIESFYCPRVTHVLCRSQRHGVVMQAIRDSKRCVTAHWLNDAIVKKQLLPPWQALHLPAPATFGRQRPATRHIVSISGFEGDERQRIKHMVAETGAKLTPYFSKQNTVLVCKKLDGPKYKRAKDWAVPVVNATWLSDILMGNLSTMANFETVKYQQYNLNCPFRIEYGLVPHLMSE